MHLTFLLILGYGAFAYGGSAGPIYGLVTTLALFTLVLLHELGHSLAALGYGIPVRDITLLPIGGMARLERMPEKPVQELVVALAGPAVNVLLAAILLPVVVALSVIQNTPLSLNLATQSGLLGLLTFLLSANVSLAVFNMLPAFPLDGGRVLRAGLGFLTDYPRATQIAAGVGRVLAVALGLPAVVMGQFWLAIIAMFIFFAGKQEAQAVATRAVLRQGRAGQAIVAHTVALAPEATVGQAASMMMGIYEPDLVVLDPHSGQLLGVASRSRILQALRQGQWYQRITDIMQHAQHIPVVAITATLDEVQDKLGQTSGQVAAVYDGFKFKGLISMNDVYRVFKILSQRPAGSRPMGWEMAG
jgi:Zn-dependent protease